MGQPADAAAAVGGHPHDLVVERAGRASLAADVEAQQGPGLVVGQQRDVVALAPVPPVPFGTRDCPGFFGLCLMDVLGT